MAVAGFALGVGAFFTFVVPEVAFTVLGPHALGAFLAAMFPRFYVIAAVLAAAMTVAGSIAFGVGRLATIAPAVALLLTLIAWIWLLPLVQAAIGTAAFGLLHGLSLGMDMIAMLLWLVGLVAAWRAKAPAAVR